MIETAVSGVDTRVAFFILPILFLAEETTLSEPSGSRCYCTLTSSRCAVNKDPTFLGISAFLFAVASDRTKNRRVYKWQHGLNLACYAGAGSTAPSG